MVKLNREQGILDREFDQFAFAALKDTFEQARTDAQAALDERQRKTTKLAKPKDYSVVESDLMGILKCFARLDGYDLWLRSVQSQQRDKKDEKAEQLAWTTPVRAWAKLDSWGKDPETAEEITRPTHDAEGNVDPEYLKFLTERLNVFDDDGTVKADFRDRLDPDCIEAADLNLSAGRHKPFVFEAGDHEKPAALIKKLDAVHADIRTKLASLLDMVEGKA